MPNARARCHASTQGRKRSQDTLKAFGSPGIVVCAHRVSTVRRSSVDLMCEVENESGGDHREALLRVS